MCGKTHRSTCTDVVGPRPTQPVPAPPAHHLRETKHHAPPISQSPSSCGDHHHKSPLLAPSRKRGHEHDHPEKRTAKGQRGRDEPECHPAARQSIRAHAPAWALASDSSRHRGAVDAACRTVLSLLILHRETRGSRWGTTCAVHNLAYLHRSVAPRSSTTQWHSRKKDLPSRDGPHKPAKPARSGERVHPGVPLALLTKSVSKSAGQAALRIDFRAKHGSKDRHAFNAVRPRRRRFRRRSRNPSPQRAAGTPESLPRPENHTTIQCGKLSERD